MIRFIEAWFELMRVGKNPEYYWARVNYLDDKKEDFEIIFYEPKGVRLAFSVKKKSLKKEEYDLIKEYGDRLASGKFDKKARLDNLQALNVAIYINDFGKLKKFSIISKKMSNVAEMLKINPCRCSGIDVLGLIPKCETYKTFNGEILRNKDSLKKLLDFKFDKIAGKNVKIISFDNLSDYWLYLLGDDKIKNKYTEVKIERNIYSFSSSPEFKNVVSVTVYEKGSDYSARCGSKKIKFSFSVSESSLYGIIFKVVSERGNKENLSIQIGKNDAFILSEKLETFGSIEALPYLKLGEWEIPEGIEFLTMDVLKREFISNPCSLGTCISLPYSLKCISGDAINWIRDNFCEIRCHGDVDAIRSYRENLDVVYRNFTVMPEPCHINYAKVDQVKFFYRNCNAVVIPFICDIKSKYVFPKVVEYCRDSGKKIICDNKTYDSVDAFLNEICSVEVPSSIRNVNDKFTISHYKNLTDVYVPADIELDNVFNADFIRELELRKDKLTIHFKLKKYTVDEFINKFIKSK